MKQKNKLFLSQVVANIPNDKPIIFWDACALVDIARIPHSTKGFTYQNLEQYEAIAHWIEEGKVISMTSDIVTSEFDTHYSREYAAMIREQNNRKNLIKGFSVFLQNVARRTRVDNAVDQLNIQNRFGSLTTRICKQTTVMRLEKEHMRFADYRTRQKIAPACKKGEYKDCYIWGTYLAVLKRLQPANLCYFITTNPKDYRQGTATTAQIAADCNSVNGHITFHIGELYSRLSRAVNP